MPKLWRAIVLLLVLLCVGVLAWRGATEATQALPPPADLDPVRLVTQPPAAELHPMGSPAKTAGPASVCSTPAPATPTPFNGATEEESSGGLGNPMPEVPPDIAPLDPAGDIFAQDICGPAPVIAEAPIPILLVLSASAGLAGAVLLGRRRARLDRSSARREDANEG